MTAQGTKSINSLYLLEDLESILTQEIWEIELELEHNLWVKTQVIVLNQEIFVVFFKSACLFPLFITI